MPPGYIILNMRGVPILFSLLLVISSLAFAPAKKAPARLTFNSRMGKVAFDHARHVKAEKDNCKACHDSLFKQDAAAPVNFKGGALHKAAETARTSCGACHRPGGTSFEAKGNCNRCHAKGA